MDKLERAWQCYNGCTVFWTVGRPTHCPFCADSEVYPVDAERQDYLIVERSGR